MNRLGWAGGGAHPDPTQSHGGEGAERGAGEQAGGEPGGASGPRGARGGRERRGVCMTSVPFCMTSVPFVDLALICFWVFFFFF